MFSSRSAAVCTLLAALSVGAAAQERFPGIGRAATAKEVAAWDIDVRPDFKGLPSGRGTVAQGQKLWEAQCAGCHGVFGESNEVFSPIVGGTTKRDIETGRVANLREPNYPQRTTMMKLSQLSTLWDYIRRAMPWTAPKTLSNDEVYALSAYILHLADVVPAEFELNERNMAATQARLPNRHGKTTEHAKWPGPELGAQRRPDVQGSACMRDCPTETTVASFIPDHARNAHGNLAAQQRTVGPQRGAATEPRVTPASPQALAAAAATPVHELLKKNVCLACHQIDAPAVGPSFKAVAAKHGARADAADYLLARIRQGGVGTWGQIPMPPQALDEADARAIAAWLAAGAKP
jgi:S-disulfanyl-L-cysteine oxidoreductase SoxD